MAVDVCSEISSPVVSPRISFSHDLNELDFVPIESHNHLHLNPTIDFDFYNIGQNLQISSADELFANGKILPVQIKTTSPPKQIDRNLNKTDNNSKKKRLIEFLSATVDDDDEEEEGKPIARSFWQFRRSSSVNCDRGGLLRSLQFLSRSNSTGSVPNPKPSGLAKVMRKQNSLREAPINRRNSAAAGLNQYYHYNKPSLGKSSSRSYGNGVRISPVLNIAPNYTVSLFGIGSLFCSKKSKKKRK
ncbi:uncharacterized protein LOC131025078 [Salvia miltiorrhiza]|uniref:uncharacterized protein LOC131025078 n=1 Tax=Salvia miltiorrhiza TaxID=226208 RepID=UPI0025ABB865|nr:uncharacterized protein LOC131025078 [Salvia miltiorrhiza]